MNRVEKIMFRAGDRFLGNFLVRFMYEKSTPWNRKSIAEEQDNDSSDMEEVNMSIFSKKTPCFICGGKISWFLPTKIEGEYICGTCYRKIDMDADKASYLTMQEFKEYLVFYDQNQLLKEQFVITEQIDFGFWDTKIIFDYQNKLFCMSENLDRTVFEGKQLKSFTIKEDNALLFESSATGIKQYASTVPERAMATELQISQFMMNRQMTRALIPEPFQTFNVELHFDHPYWTVIKCDMDGPRFNNAHPDVNDYLNDYQRSIEEIKKLVAALNKVAFPGAPDQFIVI